MDGHIIYIIYYNNLQDQKTFQRFVHFSIVIVNYNLHVYYIMQASILAKSSHIIIIIIHWLFLPNPIITIINIRHYRSKCIAYLRYRIINIIYIVLLLIITTTMTHSSRT